jgi:hypothetical protein
MAPVSSACRGEKLPKGSTNPKIKSATPFMKKPPQEALSYLQAPSMLHLIQFSRGGCQRISLITGT